MFYAVRRLPDLGLSLSHRGLSHALAPLRKCLWVKPKAFSGHTLAAADDDSVSMVPLPCHERW